MTSQEFILWLKGFTDGVHEYNVTPKQWDILKEKLAEVSDEPKTAYPFGVPNGSPFITPPPVDPYNPYKITCTPGTTITTTPGTGYIAVANPIASFGGVSSITYATGSSLGVGVTYTVPSAWSGGTAYTYPNGTTVTYTAGGANEFDNPKDKTLLND